METERLKKEYKILINRFGLAQYVCAEKRKIMNRIEEVRAKMMQAMKDKQKNRKDALSALLTALKNKAIDKRADLTTEEEDAVVLKEIKAIKETLEMTPPDRTDIMEECQYRLSVFQEFAPIMMTETEIQAVIDEVLKELQLEQPSAKDKGRIMRELMPRVKGKAEGQLVNEVLAKNFV